MSRRSTPDVISDAGRALTEALAEFGVQATIADDAPLESGGSPDLRLEVNGRMFGVEVKPVVTASDAAAMVRQIRRWSTPAVVVADRIAEGARALFADSQVNYLDRRGELRFLAPPIAISSPVPRSHLEPATAGPLSSQVAKEVAITCLLTPRRTHGVREVAAFIGRAPSAVSTSMAELRGAGLLTSNGEVVVPDLFHELSARWRRKSFALADMPRPGAGPTNTQLELGLDDPGKVPGWALTDTVAAASWGMPVVARGDYPPDFYVPSNTVLRRARTVLGDAEDFHRRACTVAVAPVRLVCLRRHDHSQTSGEIWPVANHVVVALDLATDRSRGVEILEQWHPQDIDRAW